MHIIRNLKMLFFWTIFSLTALVQSQNVQYTVSVGDTIELKCNITGYSQSTVGWYYVGESTVPTLVWQNQVWGGSVSSVHYNVNYDSLTLDLTITSVIEDDMSVLYFCYDTSTETYIKFVELVSETKSCNEKAAFSIYDIQYGDPALIPCALGNTGIDDYTWIEITSTESRIIFKNLIFIDTLYLSSFAVFDNTSHAFLYMFSSSASSFACVRSSDHMFLGLTTVTQCPQIATDRLNLNAPMGPIAYLGTGTGSNIRFYCNITGYTIDNIVWSSGKQGSSLQELWTYANGFANAAYAKTYYNVIFDANSVNFTINGINTDDFELLYFCIDKNTNTNLLTAEIVDSLATECFQSNTFSTQYIENGESYTLTCNISGLSSNDYYWTRITQKTNVIWSNGNFQDASYSSLYTEVSNLDMSNFTVNNVLGKDAYACVRYSNDEFIQFYKLVSGCLTTTTTATTTAATTTTGPSATTINATENIQNSCRRRRR